MPIPISIIEVETRHAKLANTPYDVNIVVYRGARWLNPGFTCGKHRAYWHNVTPAGLCRVFLAQMQLLKVGRKE